MEIKTLAPGEPAPANADCIGVDTRADGKFNLTGTALCGDDVVSLIGSSLLFDTRDDAVEQGVAWADAQGVDLLYVTFDALTPAD